jgi:RNase H-fold protein (predicted Holliday junction resolvase)
VSGVLGIDPGTRKAGYALVIEGGAVVARGIEPIDGLAARVAALLAEHPITALAIGKGTNADRVTAVLVPFGIPVRMVDERETTLRARQLYYAENPARGWQRLLPAGLRFPPRPIDDYAAELIARRFLALRGEKPLPS